MTAACILSLLGGSSCTLIEEMVPHARPLLRIHGMGRKPPR